MTKPNDFSVLEAGEVDVYAHGVHWWMETPWSHGITAEKLVEKGLKANPNFRAYYHAAWLVGDGRAKEIKAKDDYDSSKLRDVQAALDKTRKGVEGIVDKLNEKFGKEVVFLVPVGDATLKLRKLILEGKYPGMTKQSELWADAMPHAGVHVMALSGYCHFSAIYRRSPVGLKIARYKELSDEQHAILQKIAWDVVSKYPHAGVGLQTETKSSASSDKKTTPQAKALPARPMPHAILLSSGSAPGHPRWPVAAAAGACRCRHCRRSPGFSAAAATQGLRSTDRLHSWPPLDFVGAPGHGWSALDVYGKRDHYEHLKDLPLPDVRWHDRLFNPFRVPTRLNRLCLMDANPSVLKLHISVNRGLVPIGHQRARPRALALRHA